MNCSSNPAANSHPRCDSTKASASSTGPRRGRARITSEPISTWCGNTRRSFGSLAIGLHGGRIRPTGNAARRCSAAARRSHRAVNPCPFKTDEPMIATSSPGNHYRFRTGAIIGRIFPRPVAGAGRGRSWSDRTCSGPDSSCSNPGGRSRPGRTWSRLRAVWRSAA